MKLFHILKRKVKTVRQQNVQFFVWLFPAWVFLGISRLLIKVFAFKHLARWLGVHDGLAPRTPSCTQAQEAIARNIGRAIRVAASYTPWSSNCFSQALTARFILGLYKVPYALFFGLRRDPETDQLKAHAWVVAGRLNVTGGRGFKNYVSVGCFVSPD